MNNNDHICPEEFFELYAIRSDLPGYLDLEELFSSPMHEETWLIPNYIAKGRMTQFHGPAKTGKSMVMLNMAASIATGTPFAEMPTVQAKVLYLDYENNPQSDIRVRLEKMGFDAAQLEDNLIILSFPEIPNLDTDVGGARLAAMVVMQDIDVVVIDTVSRTISGEENSNDTWNRFYNYTGKRLKQLGTALVRIDHTGKDPQKGARGGSSKSTDVDIICRFSENNKIITIEFLEGRIKSLFQKIDLQLVDEPVLHLQRVTRPSVPTTQMRVSEICHALDTAGFPRGISNAATREALSQLKIPAAKAVSEEVARRRKEPLIKQEATERPPFTWGWHLPDSSPEMKMRQTGHRLHRRESQRPQGLEHPALNAGR